MAKTKTKAWVKGLIAVAVIAVIGGLGYYGANGEMFQGRSKLVRPSANNVKTVDRVENVRLDKNLIDKKLDKTERVVVQPLTVDGVDEKLIKEVAQPIELDKVDGDVAYTTEKLAVDQDNVALDNIAYITTDKVASISNDVTTMTSILSNDVNKVMSDLSTIKNDIETQAVSNSIAAKKLARLENLTALSGKYPALQNYVLSEFDNFNMIEKDLTQQGVVVNIQALNSTDLDSFVREQAYKFLGKNERVLAVYNVDKDGIENFTHFFPYFSYDGNANTDFKVVVLNKKGEYGFAEFNFNDSGLFEHEKNDIALSVVSIAIVATENFTGSDALFQSGFAVGVESNIDQEIFVGF